MSGSAPSRRNNHIFCFQDGPYPNTIIMLGPPDEGALVHLHRLDQVVFLNESSQILQITATHADKASTLFFPADGSRGPSNVYQVPMRIGEVITVFVDSRASGDPVNPKNVTLGWALTMRSEGGSLPGPGMIIDG